MRVSLLTNFVPPYLISLFAALRDRVDHLLLVVSTPMEANRPWGFEGDGLPVRVQRTLTLPRTWRHPSGFAERTYLHVPLDTLGILAREAPDVIVTTELGVRTLQSLLYRWIRPRTRIVLWVSISEISERGRGALRESLRRWILRRVDAAIVSGQSGARYLQRLGMPEASIFPMPLYARQADGAERIQRREREQRRLLYVGQLVERKGLAGFLAELARWAEQHPDSAVEFWLVGDGPERARLETLPRPQNLALRFFGNVAYGALDEFYASAGILVFPTLADDWGVVVNEAVAAGMPVLGSVYSQAVDDVVVESETGWRFCPETPEKTLEAVDRALCTPLDELERMRAECRKKALEFSPDLVVQHMLDAIAFATRAPDAKSGSEVAS